MILVMTIVLISTMTLISATIVSNVNAADNGSSLVYSRTHIPGSGTIGQVYCCDIVARWW